LGPPKHFACPPQHGQGSSSYRSVSRFAASFEPSMANFTSSMYDLPLYVRYGPENWIKLLGNYCVSESFQPVRPMLPLLRDTRNAVRLRHPIPRGAHSSVHPSGKPIIHSTQSGLSCPPFPAAMLRRSSSVICPRASRFFNCWKFPVPPQSPAPVVGVG